jgi:hypothetical protein
MTIELTNEEARRLAEHIDYYLTLTFYDRQDAGDAEEDTQFLEGLRDQLLSS